MGYAAGGAAAAGAAAAIAAAIKASGAIVRLDPAEFQKILNRCDAPLVVSATGGLFKKTYKYLTNYRGLFFFTKTPDRLQFPGKTEHVIARDIWVP
ncbi:MAG: hypothetical protein JSU65_03105 [Candidatus Zixiibacteriota bacterium]|nr:MAG: hypothetical protein JSU65_03105 [candidate division Zixibacteria bacterium]